MKPYLSIVTTARNDNHGGNMLHRMQIFVNGLFTQSARHKVHIELILVEWNPPPDKPGLAQALSWPASHDFCTVRIIEVPPEIHRNFALAESLPLYQMIAKNVGIRRAHGQFILATNIDILFSDELFAFFASGTMTRGKMYRAHRYDIAPHISVECSIDEHLNFCLKNVIRINVKYGTLDLRDGCFHSIYPPNAEKDRNYLRSRGIPLFTNACGDFQLMAHEHWQSLLGYPELDVFSFHLDSIMEYIAYFGGVPEEVLPDGMRIYHIEHSAGWTPETDKSGTFDKKLKESKIVRLTDDDFYVISMKMHMDNKPHIFNNEYWGLGAVSLRENVIVGT